MGSSERCERLSRDRKAALWRSKVRCGSVSPQGPVSTFDPELCLWRMRKIPDDERQALILRRCGGGERVRGDGPERRYR